MVDRIPKFSNGYAVIGIVAPMMMASAESMGYKSSKVMFPLDVVTVVTCCTLPIGAGATVAAELNGYLESYGYVDHLVGFFDPMIARLPLLIVCVIYCAFFATKLAPDEPLVPIAAPVSADKGKEPLKPFQEYAGIIIFFADALALMFAQNLGLQNWEIAVIGALAMSGALSSTGAGDLIGGYISNLVATVNGNSYIVGFIFFIVPFIMTQVMQNRGTMTIFYPIAIATCASIGANPVGLMIIIQAACLSAFMTPMATAACIRAGETGAFKPAALALGFSPMTCTRIRQRSPALRETCLRRWLARTMLFMSILTPHATLARRRFLRARSSWLNSPKRLP